MENLDEEFSKKENGSQCAKEVNKSGKESGNYAPLSELDLNSLYNTYSGIHGKPILLNGNNTSNENNNKSSDSINECGSQSKSFNTNIKSPLPVSIPLESDFESLEPETDSQNNFLCSFCNKKYYHRQSLQRHINRTHPTEKRNLSATIKCLEESCNFSCRYLHQLREHLMESHDFQFKMQSETFDSHAGIYICAFTFIHTSRSICE